MKQIKCENCGGKLENESEKFVRCQYCGSKFEILPQEPKPQISNAVPYHHIFSMQNTKTAQNAYLPRNTYLAQNMDIRPVKTIPARPVNRMAFIIFLTISIILTISLIPSMAINSWRGATFSTFIPLAIFYSITALLYNRYKIKTDAVRKIITKDRITLQELCYALHKPDGYSYKLRLIVQELIRNKNITGYILTGDGVIIRAR